MRILVTGSRGMLGRRLTEILAPDHELYGCGRSKPLPVDLDYCYEPLDLTDLTKTKKFLSRTRPEVIFHLAAKTQVDECELKPKEAWENNSLATQNLSRAARPFGPIFFYLSSDYVFDGNKKAPYKPSDPVSPASVYGRTKAEGESWVERFCPKRFIVRTSWLYGPDGPNFVDSILRLTSVKKELRVVRDQTGRPTYTRDLAQTLYLLLKKIQLIPKIPYGILHCSAGGPPTTWNRFASEIISLAGRKIPVVPITAGDLARPAPRPCNSVLDLRSLKQLWGIEPRSWKEGLADYLREKGYRYE